MKNQLLSTLLTLCMVLTLLPGTAWAADIIYPVTGGNIYFDVTTGTITGCDSSVTEADIPNEIYGVPVTSIGNHAFENHNGLTSVTIPDSVTSIEQRAFYGCLNLASVAIPNGVTSIEYQVFYGCSKLTSVTIPSSVTSIGTQAFYGCTSLTSINIPDGVTSIGEAVFYGCSSLTSVTIPDSVTSVGELAFYGCGLTSMIIPSSVTSISKRVFATCSSLESVTIPDSVTSIAEYAFGGCGLTSVIIPDSMASIDGRTFDGCSKLTSVIIPSSVTTIYDTAFYDCKSLTDVYYSGSVLEWAEVKVHGNALPLSATVHFNAYPIILDPNGGSVSTPVVITGEDGKLSDLPIPIRDGYAFDGWYMDAAGGIEVTTKTAFTEKRTVHAHWTPAFTDVPNDIYYAVPVSWAIRNGIANGTGNNAFSPDTDCTRAQIITFLWRAYGSLEPTVYNSPFADVTDAGAYYYKAILWAAENGITANAGLSTDAFGPDTPCTRAQAVTFMYRAAGSPSVSGTSSFSDVGASSYYKDAVTWAVTNGITNGMGDNQFLPGTICNRAQIVTFLWRGLAE